MAWLYADENFSYRVIERLRTMGHNVLTVQEAGERGHDDAHVLRYVECARATIESNSESRAIP